MSLQWQISAAELSELARPATWTLSALVSAWVLKSASHHRFKSYTVAALTLGTLFFPLIVLPLYLIARIRVRRRAPSRQTGFAAKPTAKSLASSPALKRILPALYLVVVLSLIVLFFYRDYQSLDAHLWRANNAKLRGPHEKVIAEYRAALQLEDDPHTHKLLAIELAVDGRNEEALAEFRAAERGGEPDARIPYYTGTALDSLGREQEAATEYKRFLNGPLCTQALPDANCATARTRVAAIKPRQGR